MSVAMAVRAWGVSFWGGFALYMQRGSAATLSGVIRDRVSALYREPGNVASYLWPATSDGVFTPAAAIASLAALIALAVTLRSWLPAARRSGAEPSARLLHSLLGPMLAIEAVGIVVLAATAMGAVRSEETRRLFFAILALPALVPMAAWLAAVRGALFAAVGRAIGNQEPWSPPAIAFGALRHFRALFWLTLTIQGLQMVGSLALATLASEASPAVAQLRQTAFTVLWGIASWTYVVLALAPAAAVSEEVGPWDGVRLALLAWRRVPLHLATAIVLGMAALWAVWVAGPMILRVSAGSVGVAIILKLLGLAVQAVGITWAAAVALLLWQRVRGRVMAPAS